MEFEKIININTIGLPYESKEISNNDIYNLTEEQIITSNDHKNLLLIIDPQNDFMEDGNLAVKGAGNDILNLTTFIYNNLRKIDKIKVSLDSHTYKQIFSQIWWEDEDGNHPDLYTIIDQDSQYKPVFYKEHSMKYLKHLAENDKELIIWPYHCLLGTFGHNIEANLENMLSYFSLVTKKTVEKITKGSNPLSEMYGIFKEEFSDANAKINPMLAKAYGKYENIIVAGEAKSHCVLETVKQMCEFYAFDHFNSNIIILEDCMSSIEGFEEKTDKAYASLVKKYNVTLTTSKKMKL